MSSEDSVEVLFSLLLMIKQIENHSVEKLLRNNLQA